MSIFGRSAKLLYDCYDFFCFCRSLHFVFLTRFYSFLYSPPFAPFPSPSPRSLARSSQKRSTPFSKCFQTMCKHLVHRNKIARPAGYTHAFYTHTLHLFSLSSPQGLLFFHYYQIKIRMWIQLNLTWLFFFLFFFYFRFVSYAANMFGFNYIRNGSCYNNRLFSHCIWL